ncbi:MAG: polyphenol oxidase family protein [Microthrixaceae bacterium]
MSAGPVDSEAYEFVASGGLRVLRWPRLDSTGVLDAVVTTRRGGVSDGVYDGLNLGLHVGDDPVAVIENRARAATAIGLDLDDLVFSRQTHGSKVAQVGLPERGRGTRSDSDALPDTDAVVTSTPGVGLVIMVADCVPIVLVDPIARVLGCVHAGWRGATQRVVAAAVEKMVDVGAERSRMLVGMGPAIPADRYQVGEDVLAAVTDAFAGEADQVIRPDGTGRWLFDGWMANLLALRDSGVAESNISLARLATGQGEFFSDRASRPCGRFAVLAALKRPLPAHVSR